MTDPGDKEHEHAWAAAREQLTRATLDHQAEIIRLTAIQNSMSEALMTMELQLRYQEALLQEL